MPGSGNLTAVTGWRHICTAHKTWWHSAHELYDVCKITLHCNYTPNIEQMQKDFVKEKTMPQSYNLSWVAQLASSRCKTRSRSVNVQRAYGPTWISVESDFLLPNDSWPKILLCSIVLWRVPLTPCRLNSVQWFSRFEIKGRWLGEAIFVISSLCTGWVATPPTLDWLIDYSWSGIFQLKNGWCVAQLLENFKIKFWMKANQSSNRIRTQLDGKKGRE